MTLKYLVETVPEGLESYYKETDKGFVLDVEGAVAADEFVTVKTKAEEALRKLAEFRDHNIALRKQVETGAKGEGGNPPNIEELIETAVNELKGKLNATAGERDKLKSQLEEVVLSDRVKDIAIRHGVFESALPDIVARAKGVFTVNDGKPVPLNKNSRDENGELLNPESWLKKLQEDAPHLFKPSTGSGAHRPVNGVRGTENRSGTQKIADALSGQQTATKKVM